VRIRKERRSARPRELLSERDIPIRALVRRDDDRAEGLRALGAGIVVGDLTRPLDVVNALDGVGRMFSA
jgi:uncharacterized protein YbjT (DUF2867 family)